MTLAQKKAALLRKYRKAGKSLEWLKSWKRGWEMVK